MVKTRTEESTAIEPVQETLEIEPPVNPVPEASSSEPTETGLPPTIHTPEEVVPATEASVEESPQPQGAAEEKGETEEESEPFADILGENKDKKRYSPNPLPQQSSEQA